LVGEVDYDFATTKISRPIRPWADFSDRSEFGARDSCRRTAGYPENVMAARREAPAQRTADKARRTGYQNPRQTLSSDS
jgi:hypothetical protein